MFRRIASTRCSAIRLHPGRPSGINEPTADGVAGAAQMLQMVAELGPDDLCLVLLSGGAGACCRRRWPASRCRQAGRYATALARRSQHSRTELRPQAVVTHQRGPARRRLPRRHADRPDHLRHRRRSAGRDRLRTNRRGFFDSRPTPLAVLQQFDPQLNQTPPAHRQAPAENNGRSRRYLRHATTQVFNHIIGNNQAALSAAEEAARRLVTKSPRPKRISKESPSDSVATWHSGAVHSRPIVADAPLHPQRRRTGGAHPAFIATAERGRNQELALAALPKPAGRPAWPDICILSGGTDGEDGPTDAAERSPIRPSSTPHANWSSIPAELPRGPQLLRVLRANRRPPDNRPDTHERHGRPRWVSRRIIRIGWHDL